jgi:hypothetical protein
MMALVGLLAFNFSVILPVLASAWPRRQRRPMPLSPA